MSHKLAVLITTYNRKAHLLKTINAIARHLICTDSFHIFVADDGSDDGTQEAIKPLDLVSLVQSDRGGLGANANAGLRAAFAFSPFVFQLQDDMVMRENFYADKHLSYLTNHLDAGYLRLWGVAGHNYHARLRGTYWRLDWDSPELYLTSDRPHLKHLRWHETFGLYPEKLKTAETEEAWCHQCKDLARRTLTPLRVDVPLMDTESNFDHIGWDARWREKGL